jgi:predicted amidohydrolase
MLPSRTVAAYEAPVRGAGLRLPVTAVAAEPVLDGLTDRAAWLAAAATQAAAASADLLVLPELWQPGYEWLRLDPDRAHQARVRALAEPVPGPTTENVRLVARRTGLVIVFGLLERGRKGLYNTAVAVGADGVLFRYRKTHLYGAEPVYCIAGEALTVWESRWGRVGLLICHDKEFPGAARRLARAGAGLVIILSAWPAPTPAEAEAETALYRAYDAVRAAENGFWVVSSNYAGGRYAGGPFVGGSGVYDPIGHPVGAPLSAIGWIGRLNPQFAAPPFALDWRQETRPDLDG